MECVNGIHPVPSMTEPCDHPAPGVTEPSVAESVAAVPSRKESTAVLAPSPGGSTSSVTPPAQRRPTRSIGAGSANKGITEVGRGAESFHSAGSFSKS